MKRKVGISHEECLWNEKMEKRENFAKNPTLPLIFQDKSLNLYREWDTQLFECQVRLQNITTFNTSRYGSFIAINRKAS